MKQIYVNLGVVRGLFGFPKSFEKQQFEERLYAHFPDKTEYGDNEYSVKDAFGTAINMLFKLWNNKTCRSLVAQTIPVMISFNSDYSIWRVDMDPYGNGTPLQEAHPDFSSFFEEEKNKIFEKYGFAEEKKPPKKFEVAYGGLKTIMNEEQLRNFLNEIIKMYPRSWHMMSSIKEVK